MTEDPMQPDEVAAKARDILSGLLADSGQALVNICFKDHFTMQEIAESSLLPESNKPSLGKAAEG